MGDMANDAIERGCTELVLASRQYEKDISSEKLREMEKKGKLQLKDRRHDKR